MRILVTGGCGLIGSHLCEHLLNNNHDVVCFDNLSSGSMSNIEHLLKNKHFSFIYHDVKDFFHTDVEQIYHLACPASPVIYQMDPINTMKINIFGSLNVLDIALKNNATVLLASTSEVYGDPTISPQDESYRGNVNCTGPRACYDEGKRSAETLFSDHRRMYNTDIRIARIFNTYGPKLNRNDGRVVSNFITQALDNNPITIYGNGSQTRSFCYVDDTVKGLIDLMNSNCVTPVNIGNPHEITIEELAHKIIELTDSQSTLTTHQLPEDDPSKRKPSIHKASTLFNWYPSTSLSDGLIKTINYFKSVFVISYPHCNNT